LIAFISQQIDGCVGSTCTSWAKAMDGHFLGFPYHACQHFYGLDSIFDKKKIAPLLKKEEDDFPKTHVATSTQATQN
jgi:hypothetical protein